MKTKIAILIMAILVTILFSGTVSAADNNTTNTTNNTNYSTYLGGTGTESASDTIVDKYGNVYVTGSTSSTDFPRTNGTYKSNVSGSGDVFVSKFSSNGTLIFSTYFGGSGGDGGSSIALDKDGNIYITGQTKSTDFPTTSDAYQTSLHGAVDIFLVKLSSDAGTLLYSSYLGGNSTDATGASVETPAKIAIDNDGNIYVIGQTNSLDFPTTADAYKKNVTIDPTYGVYYGDVFLTKFNSQWNMTYSTLLGGASSADTPYGIAFDSQNNVWLTGKTASFDFPTTSDAYQTAIGLVDYSDAFLTKFSSNGTLLYSSFFGKSSTDYGYAIAIDKNGYIYITGQTSSADLPVTSDAYQKIRNGSSDIYLAKFNSSGSLIYCTYFGGTGVEDSRGIAFDDYGNIYVTGRTSSGFPVTSNAIQSTHKGGTWDAFFTKFNANMTAVLYSTLLGGSGSDFAYDVAVDDQGNAYLVGTTPSTNFLVTTGAYQTARSGSSDAFITKIVTSPSVNVSQAGGIFNTTQNVTLSTTNGTIYYTTDGSDPTNSSTRNAYNDSVQIDHDTTLKFAAVDSLGNWSPIGTQYYVIDVNAPMVSVDVKGGLYNSTQTVVLNVTDDRNNSTVYYTTDGSDPVSSVSKQVYSGPISVDHSLVLKFAAVDEASNWSPVYSESYVLDTKLPTATVNVKGGVYNSDKAIVLKMSESGTIYYTTDGSTPTEKSKKYTGSFKVSSNTTLKFIAVDLAGNKSPVYMQKYTIDKIGPKVAVTSPKNGAKKVSKTSTITITFNESIKKGVNWSKVYMKNLRTGTLVSISKWISGNSLKIKMKLKRYPRTLYAIYIPASAFKDAAGNKQAKGYTLKFRTK